MSNINVVIDTNVLITALRSKQGASHKLLLLLADDAFTPNVSVPLFVEYEAVAKRTGLLSGFNSNDINSILDYFLSKSKIRKIFYLWRPFLKDQKDDLVLEVAVQESQNEYIITFNTSGFSGCEKFGVKIVTPYEFMKIRGLLS